MSFSIARFFHQPLAAFAALFLLGTLALPAADPVVSNVSARQVPGTKTVEITYDLTADSPTRIEVKVSADNGASWTVPATSFSGEGYGWSVKDGTGKKILWNAGADWPGQNNNQVRFDVTATLNPVVGDYLVIDISGGASAASYPVGYLTSVPNGGWTDEFKTTYLVLRYIPADTFTMGSPDSELGRQSDEIQHQVTLTKDFYIGIYEVTQRQWELVMGNNPSYFKNATHYASRSLENVSYYEIRENPENRDDSAVNWPANSTVNATSFIGKLRAKTGLTDLDLPTEAQWEYACRAGTTMALNSDINITNSENDPEMAKVGRFSYNSGHSIGNYTWNSATSQGTAKVGSYPPNAWGLYDMHGNVSEWCLDWFDVYVTSPVSDPTGSALGKYRVLRGGAWDGYARDSRSASRNEAFPDGRGYNVGFRLASTLP